MQFSPSFKLFSLDKFPEIGSVSKEDTYFYDSNDSPKDLCQFTTPTVNENNSFRAPFHLLVIILNICFPVTCNFLKFLISSLSLQLLL